MHWPALDARAWNLSLPAVALAAAAACGPVVTPEDETDTEPPPTACEGNDDCPAGQACFEGQCIPYYSYTSDHYYCQDGTGGCCYDGCPPPDHECEEDLDCGPEGRCDEYYECGPFPLLPACEADLAVVSLELPSGDESFVSLSFVDANGDAAQDLVVGRQGVTRLQLGPGDMPPVELPLPPGASVIDAVSGDLDGDGLPDLVVSTLEGHLVALVGDGSGGFVLASDEDVGAPHDDLTTLQWDGDGLLDVAAIGPDDMGMAVVHLGGGTGAFVGTAVLDTFYDRVGSLAGLDLDGDPYGDLVVQNLVGAQIFLGGAAGDIEPDEYLSGERPSSDRQLLTGSIDGAAPHEVVGHVITPTWVEIVVWRGAGGTPYYFKLEEIGPQIEMGDQDGDGSSDVVVAGDELVTFLRGDPDGPLPLSCRISFLTGMPLADMSMGDLDGNGRADVALGATAGIVTVLLSQ